MSYANEMLIFCGSDKCNETLSRHLHVGRHTDDILILSMLSDVFRPQQGLTYLSRPAGVTGHCRVDFYLWKSMTHARNSIKTVPDIDLLNWILAVIVNLTNAIPKVAFYIIRIYVWYRCCALFDTSYGRNFTSSQTLGKRLYAQNLLSLQFCLFCSRRKLQDVCRVSHKKSTGTMLTWSREMYRQ